jgi:hypothetical protein
MSASTPTVTALNSTLTFVGLPKRPSAAPLETLVVDLSCSRIGFCSAQAETPREEALRDQVIPTITKAVNEALPALIDLQMVADTLYGKFPRVWLQNSVEEMFALAIAHPAIASDVAAYLVLCKHVPHPRQMVPVNRSEG